MYNTVTEEDMMIKKSSKGINLVQQGKQVKTLNYIVFGVVMTFIIVVVIACYIWAHKQADAKYQKQQVQHEIANAA